MLSLGYYDSIYNMYKQTCTYNSYNYDGNSNLHIFPPVLSGKSSAVCVECY